MKLLDLRDWMRGTDAVVVGCGPSADPYAHDPAGNSMLRTDRSEIYRSRWTMACNRSVAFSDPDFITCVEPFRSPIWTVICAASPLVTFWHQASDSKHKPPARRMVQFLDKNMWQLLTPGHEGMLRVNQCPFYAAALCVFLGFKTIGLIGVDLTPDRYPDPSEAIEGYGKLAAHATEFGSELVNLSPISRLSSVPQADWSRIRRK